MARFHYPLTNLLHEAQQQMPHGSTYALKGANFPKLDTPPGQIVIEDETAKLFIINAAPHRYVLSPRKLADDLVLAQAEMAVNEYGHVIGKGAIDVGDQDPLSGELYQRHRQVWATRLSGLVLPKTADLQAVGVYVAGEPSTGFVHFQDRAQAEPAMHELFGASKKGYN